MQILVSHFLISSLVQLLFWVFPLKRTFWRRDLLCWFQSQPSYWLDSNTRPRPVSQHYWLSMKLDPLLMRFLSDCHRLCVPRYEASQSVVPARQLPVNFAKWRLGRTVSKNKKKKIQWINNSVVQPVTPTFEKDFLFTHLSKHYNRCNEWFIHLFGISKFVLQVLTRQENSACSPSATVLLDSLEVNVGGFSACFAVESSWNFVVDSLLMLCLGITSALDRERSMSPTFSES